MSRGRPARKRHQWSALPWEPTLTWIVGAETFTMPRSPEACSFCGVTAIVQLPPPLRAEQPDDTTHVCHPGIGGCNHGFSDLPESP